MIYRIFKYTAAFSIVLHIILMLVSITDVFNYIFIAIGTIVLLMPNKYWGVYILPAILSLGGVVVAGYFLVIYLIT